MLATILKFTGRFWLIGCIFVAFLIPPLTLFSPYLLAFMLPQRLLENRSFMFLGVPVLILMGGLGGWGALEALVKLVVGLRVGSSNEAVPPHHRNE